LRAHRLHDNWCRSASGVQAHFARALLPRALLPQPAQLHAMLSCI
jgi:hypothetical protein